MLLFVSVSVPANEASVAVAVGKVYVWVLAPRANVVAPAPVVVSDAPSVIVLLLLSTPVPPLAAGRMPERPEEMLGMSPAAIAR